MQKTILILLLLASGLSLTAQDFMLQGWYWDYDKDGCNGYAGSNWTTRLNNDATALAAAGFTYVWLPPASRASFGKCSNGYDPQDLYDLGDDIDPGSAGQERTGFGTRAEVDALIANFNSNGIASVADVVYNHRDGGAPEDNPAVKAYIETHFNGVNNPFMGKQPYPSDRYRVRLPLGGTYGAGTYYIKLRSKTQLYTEYGGVAYNYKFYATVASKTNPFVGAINESEPNGGSNCDPDQPNDVVQLDQDFIGTLYDWANCYTDELQLTITGTDFDAAGDDLLISMTNVNSGYSDHYVEGVYYAPENGSGFDVDLADLKYQTFTDFTGLPSGQGGMNFENFRPNSDNTATTFMAGDFDSPLFFYDVVQEEASTATTYNDWTHWLLDEVGFGGLRMDAVKHFPPAFVSQLLDDMAARGENPGMVVGEFFDGNAGALKGWVDAVNAGVNASTSNVRVFDFSLRNALKEACDNGGYDLRNVYNAALADNGLSGFNVVTFVNNHDFRKPGEPVQNDPLLAYAYILTNNQLGVPTVFYPDFFGSTIPNAPTVDLEEDIAELMAVHQAHIVGASSREYLNRYDTPYAANYQQGNAGDALIFQLSGGPGVGEVVVAVNFGYGTLKVDQEIKFPALRAMPEISFADMTGNAYNATTTTDENNRILIDVPARSYAVYVANSILPAELTGFQAVLADKGRVLLDWKTASEVSLDYYAVEASTDGVNFAEVTRIAPQRGAAAYELTDDRPWEGTLRYYRLRIVSLDGGIQLSPVRVVAYGNGATDLRAYPNPAGEWLAVRGVTTDVGLEIFSADGRPVAVESTRTEAGFELRVGELPAGVYWLRAGAAVCRVVVK